MASLKDIKRRIRSVKSTQKITNAMKLVSASKFAKATHSVTASRPYGRGLDQMVDSLVASASDDVESIFLGAPRSKKVLVIIVGSDRGLCGGLNTNLFKAAERFLGGAEVKDQEISVLGSGRRPMLYAQKLGYNEKGVEKVLGDTSYLSARDLASSVLERFRSGEFGSIYIAYPRFKSAVEQEPTVKKLLPFARTPQAEKGTDFLLEPGGLEMIEGLICRWVISTIHRVLLESAASEHGARMSAMDNATNNAKEVQKKLTLVYNRARQAAITTELTEIISGAEALH